MIKLCNLSKIYGEKLVVLDNVSLKIQKGEIFGIVGRSGVGKSTLFKLLVGIESPTSGRIEINGKDLSLLNLKELRKLRSEIGVVFQQFNLMSLKTVWQNIAFPLKIAGYPKSYIKERVEYLASLFGLSDKLNCYPGNLSGGQKQRVCIARALAIKPKILLCDEATSALDQINTSNVISIFKEFNNNYNVTIVVISHEMDFISSLCKRIVKLDKGKILDFRVQKELYSLK